MKIQQAYEIWSTTYDQDHNLTRDLDQEITQQTHSQLRVRSVLEIGCGTGKNTTLLASVAERVTALDFSASMIAKARARASLNNVIFCVSDVTQPWPIEQNSVDLVTCNLVLEHIEDLSFVFSEAARVLTKGGRLFVSELHPFRQYLGVQARFQQELQTQTIDAYVHDVTDFIDSAQRANLSLEEIQEWRHAKDKDKPPRLISFTFTKGTAAVPHREPVPSA